MTKREYIEKLNEERLNVLKACEGLADDELSKPMGEGKWSVKDTLGHLAAWEGEVVKAFEQKARGERPTIGDISDYNAWNGVQAANRKDLSPAEIRREFHDNRARLMTIVSELPDDAKVWDPERSTAKMLGMLIQHDEHHWRQIHDHRCRAAGECA